ncbi:TRANSCRIPTION FACTOR TFIIIB COMPONENT B''-like protein [Salix purpurea]|uniref:TRANSCRIPTION FACTOR TFIIIB COMPONENT B''-like protein n=1 Tax=Salix purpurea TaxID=77065 RepID=A0A9Q0TXP4_SALPP|nr:TRANSCRIPTION FACTOR TFIIIB COMPONENT B''-like protein [Salix purpurea]
MDPDLDPFDDILPKPTLTNARSAGKFQPKAKPRPKKVEFVPIPSIPPSKAKEKAVAASQTSLDTAISVQPVGIMDEKLTGQIGSLSPSAPTGTKEPLKSNDGKTKLVEESGSPLATSDMVGVKEPQKYKEGLPSWEIGSLEAANLTPVRRNDAGSVGAVDSEADCNGNQKYNFVKSAGAAGSLGFDSDLLDDIFPKSLKTRAGGKFKPNVKPWQRNENPEPVSSSPSKCAEEEPKAHSQKTQSTEPVYVANTRMNPIGRTLLQQGNVESNEPSKDSEVLYLNSKSCLELVNPSSDNIATEEFVCPHNTQLSEMKSGNDVGLNSRFVESAIEVGSMRLDLDAFDYTDPQPAISIGRAADKLQSKVKACPRKGTSELAASAVPVVEKVAGLTSTVLDNTPPTESSGAENGRLTHLVCEPLMESAGTKEPGRNNSKALLSPPEMLATVSCEKDPKGKSSFPVKNFFDSSASIKYDVVATNFISSNEAAVQVDNGRLELEESGAFPGLETPGFLSPDVMESVMAPPTDVQPVPSETINIEGSSVGAFPSDNIVDSLSTHPGDFIPPDTCTSEIQMNQELENLTETNVTGIHQEDASDLPEKETSSSRKRKDAPASYSSWKSQKASLAGDMNEHDRSARHPRKQVAVPQLGDEPEDEGHGNGGLPLENIDDDSSMHSGNFIPVDPCTLEAQVDQNQKYFTESNCLANANVVHSEDVPVVPGKESSKSGKRKVFSASNCSRKSKKSSLAAGTQVVDELDEAQDNGGLLAEPPGSSVDEEDNDSEPGGDEERADENRVQIASRKKRASKKSKEPVTEKEKQVRKCNRSNDTPEQPMQEPRKKFSHSTRRNKRCVKKDLLDMPEDEIDFKRLPIRDIILFAEYKERLLCVKEATTSKIPPNNQSSDNPFHGGYSHYEEDEFASEQDKTHDDDQTYVRAQPSSSLFNHQSFTDRAPNSRWSKQDTELFYEGIQQFGTDLSMIQQLFPGRTRHQVKLKYKKEERQNPLRLHEALSRRPKDNSYFEKLIEQLQEVAAIREEQESYKDDLVDVSGEEDAELNAENNDEVTKPKQDEDVGVEEDQEENVVAEDHHGPPKSGVSDEDVGDIWGSYGSEF